MRPALPRRGRHPAPELLERVTKTQQTVSSVPLATTLPTPTFAPLIVTRCLSDWPVWPAGAYCAIDLTERRAMLTSAQDPVVHVGDTGLPLEDSGALQLDVLGTALVEET
jgi:hypothetical protein